MLKCLKELLLVLLSGQEAHMSRNRLQELENLRRIGPLLREVDNRQIDLLLTIELEDCGENIPRLIHARREDDLPRDLIREVAVEEQGGLDS